MAFNFPSAPAENQVFASPGGPIYVFKSPVWIIQSLNSAGGGAIVSIGDAAPASPVVGQVWWESDTGNTFIWYNDGNTAQWVQANLSVTVVDDFVKKIGDTMSGDLTISKGTPSIALDKAASGQTSQILGRMAGKLRWSVALGTSWVESSGNVGSDFAVGRFDDAGGYIDSPLTIRRSDGRATFTGDVLVDRTGVSAQLSLRETGTTFRSQINFMRDTINMASLFANGDAAGDFYGYVQDDSSVSRNWLQVVRASGRVVLPTGQLTFPAVQNPSSEVNTLDDYEEGAWVPSLKFGGNAVGLVQATSQGRYVKAGSTVKWWARIFLSSKGTSVGAATVAGLPYAISGSVGFFAGTVGYFSPNTGVVAPSAMAIGGGSGITLYHGATNVISDTNFAATSDIYLSGSYEASA